MNREETAFLLKRIEALDPRLATNDADVFRARRDGWLEVIGSLDFTHATEAVQRFYRNAGKWPITPHDVWTLSRRDKPDRRPDPRDDRLVGPPTDLAARMKFFQSGREPSSDIERLWVTQAREEA